LEDQELPAIQQSFLEQDLGHLRRFAGSRRGAENDSIPFSVGIDEFVFNFPDWQFHKAPLQQMFANILAKSESGSLKRASIRLPKMESTVIPIAFRSERGFLSDET